jgi:hypothetical protein
MPLQPPAFFLYWKKNHEGLVAQIHRLCTHTELIVALHVDEPRPDGTVGLRKATDVDNGVTRSSPTKLSKRISTIAMLSSSAENPCLPLWISRVTFTESPVTVLRFS